MCKTKDRYKNIHSNIIYNGAKLNVHKKNGDKYWCICMIKCHASNKNDTYNNTDISEMYGTDRYL